MAVVGRTITSFAATVITCYFDCWIIWVWIFGTSFLEYVPCTYVTVIKWFRNYENLRPSSRKGFGWTYSRIVFINLYHNEKCVLHFQFKNVQVQKFDPFYEKSKKKSRFHFARLVFNDANRFLVLLWVDAHAIELCMSFGLEFRWIHFLFQFKSRNNSTKTLEFRPPAKYKHEIMLTVF